MRIKKSLIAFFILICGLTLFSCNNSNNNDETLNVNHTSSNIANQTSSNENQTTSEIQSTLSKKEIINDMIEIFQETTSVDFDFFDAYIEKGGKKIGGIAFTNYSEGYKSVSTNEVYYASGFIRYDNATLTENDINNGIIIKTDDERFNNSDYIYAYPTFKGINDTDSTDENSASSVIPTHYIHQGNYIKWDIKDDKLNYSATPYLGQNTKGIDDSKGNIYDYDKNEYAYITENMPFVPIDGTALATKNYTKSVLNMLDDILNNQNINFTDEELKTYIATASDAIKEAIHNSKLLSTQEETFLGFSVEEIENYLEESDPYQYLRITVNEQGIQQLELINMDLIPSLEEKIITAVLSITGYATGIALKIIPGVNIVGHILGGALMNVCQTAFDQVIIANKPVDDAFWTKVGAASAIGAVSSIVCGAFSLFKSELVDKVIGGIMDFGSDILGSFINTTVDGEQFTALDAAITGLTSLTGQVICGVASAKIMSETKEVILLEKFNIKNTKYIHLDNENLDFLVKTVNRNKTIVGDILGFCVKETLSKIDNDISNNVRNKSYCMSN